MMPLARVALFSIRLLPIALLALRVAPAAASAGPASVTSSSVVITPQISATAQRITISLTANASEQSPQNYTVSRNTQISSAEIPERLRPYAGNPPATHYFDLGNDPAGRAYHLLARNADLKILASQNYRQTMYFATVLREDKANAAAASAVEQITSGILTNNQVDIPFHTRTTGVGSNHITEIPGALTFSINGSSGDQLSGWLNIRTSLSLTGSTLLKGSRLSVTLSGVSNLTPTFAQAITLNLQPFDPNVPARAGSGTLGEPISLGSSKVAVESVAPDYSSITLAVVYGDLAQVEAEQTTTTTALPALAQVELFDRKLLSNEDLLSQAGEHGYLVLIFGEFRGNEPSPPYYSGPRGPQSGSQLQLSTKSVIDTLAQAGTSSLKVAFVVRSIDIRALYAEYLNSRPEYLVLSDFADPTAVQFRSPPNPNSGYYSGPSYPADASQKQSTLRQTLNLPPDRVSIMVFDGAGKTLYAKPDAGDNLQAALLEAVAAIRATQ